MDTNSNWSAKCTRLATVSSNFRNYLSCKFQKKVWSNLNLNLTRKFLFNSMSQTIKSINNSSSAYVKKLLYAKKLKNVRSPS